MDTNQLTALATLMMTAALLLSGGAATELLCPRRRRPVCVVVSPDVHRMVTVGQGGLVHAPNGLGERIVLQFDELKGKRNMTADLLVITRGPGG